MCVLDRKNRQGECQGRKQRLLPPKERRKNRQAKSDGANHACPLTHFFWRMKTVPCRYDVSSEARLHTRVYLTLITVTQHAMTGGRKGDP